MTSSVLGNDTKTGQKVELHKSARTQGLYIIGRQGTGKSGLIENLIVQDMKQGFGVCVLDPHGELIDHVIARLDARREPDVILLDIRDFHYPFGLNLFTCSDPTNPLAVQEVVDRVLHVFEKLLGVTQDTPLILDYLRKCTYTLVANPGYTMAEIPLLLTDKRFRQQLVNNVTDSDVLLFWKDYEQKHPSEQATERAGILRRIGEFLQSVSRPIVGQAQSTIDFRNIMDEQKIILVKLDSLRLSSVTNLIGSLIIAAFLTAAPTRIKKQHLFTIYADEFQRFATEDFATLLEEARKYSIGTTIAHQNRAQLELSNKQAEKELKKRVLNVGSLIVFCVPTDAEELAGQFDCTPPPPLIIGFRPILTPKNDVVDHLQKQGHVNPHVSAFTNTYLIPAIRVVEQNKKTFYGTWVAPFPGALKSKIVIKELDEAIHQLNSLLFTVMMNKQADIPIPPFIFGMFALLFHFSHGLLRYITLWNPLTGNPVPSLFQPKPELLLLAAPDFLQHQAHLAQKIDPYIFPAAMAFTTSLRQTMQVLASNPILVNTGQHLPIYDKPRQFADVQNEIANMLVVLPDFTARVRIKGEPEHIIQTIQPAKGLSKLETDQRISRIQAQNRDPTYGYTRLRQDVEREIAIRQSQWSNQANSSPQPPARKMQVCATCGAHNRQGALFCNQCGSPV